MFITIKPTLVFLFIIIVPLVATASDADSDHLDDSIASTPGSSWFNGLVQGQDESTNEASTDASEINLDDEDTTDSSMFNLEDGEDENATSSLPWYDPLGLMQGQGEESTELNRVVRSADDDSEATTLSSSDETEAPDTADYDVIDDNNTTQANNTNGNETDAFNFASTAATSTFSCDKRKFGYYADVGRNCTIYHLCNPVTLANNPDLVYQRISFLCLQNSTFDQLTLSCTKHPQISCDISPSYYDSSNLAIRRSASDFNQNKIDDDDDESDDDEDEASTDSDEDGDDNDESATPTSRPGLMSILFPNHRR